MTQHSRRDTSSLERGLAVLFAVRDRGEGRADAIAAGTGIPLSTVYRYLRTLREAGLVTEADGLYGPGVRVFGEARGRPGDACLYRLTLPVLRDLAGRTGQTAVALVRSGIVAVCLRQVRAALGAEIALQTNEILPLHAGAGSRVLLAYAPSATLELVEHVMSHEMPPQTPGALPRDELRLELERIRRNGFAVSRGQYAPGAAAVAVARPVFLFGEILCSLAVVGVESHCGSAWEAAALATLSSAVESLGDLLHSCQCHRSILPAILPGRGYPVSPASDFVR